MENYYELLSWLVLAYRHCPNKWGTWDRLRGLALSRIETGFPSIVTKHTLWFLNKIKG